MFVNPDTGQPMDFPEVVSALLVAEHGRTKEEADALVKRYPNVVTNGIMAGINYRATAMALEMKESEDSEPAE